MVEGNGVNATARLTGFNKRTILRLLVDIGTACQKFHDKEVRRIACLRVQCDELWAFVGAKDKNLPEEKKDKFGHGSVWTWTAIDADTKLMIDWLVGLRTAEYANMFMQNVADRIVNRVQLTTDGLHCYIKAVEDAFGDEVDFAQLRKVYGPDKSGEPGRYSPPVVLSAETIYTRGNPDPKHIATSYVERSNLTWRMTMRRFTRLTNGFSKKVENLMHAVALTFTYYNFCRVHQSLRTTPAMAAGIADEIWEIEDLVALID